MKMEVLQAISNRRSHRAYKPDQLTEDVLAAILKARLECPAGYDFVIALALGYATDNKNAHDLREENISRIG